MTSSRTKTFFATILVTALVGGLAPAKAFAGGDKIAKMAEELSLTPEQKEKLKKIHADFHKTLPEKRKAMEKAKDDLQTALRGSGSDEEIRKKFDELQKRQDEFADSRFEKVLTIRALLTPEQRQKFKGLEEKHKGHCREKHGEEDGMD